MFDSHVFFQSVFVLVDGLANPARGRSIQGWVSVGIVTSGIGVEGEGPVTHGTLPSTFRVLDYSLETCNKCRNLFFNRQDFYPTTCRQEIKIEERKKDSWRKRRNKQHSKSFSLVIIIHFRYKCWTGELSNWVLGGELFGNQVLGWDCSRGSWDTMKPSHMLRQTSLVFGYSIANATTDTEVGTSVTVI